MSDEERPDPQVLVKFVAKRIAKDAKTGGVVEAELAQRISEIELDTQILSASFLKLHVIDPELTLTNSGFISLNKEGFLEPIEIEFPEKSKWNWILCAVEGSTEVTRGLELTFESKIIADLREFFGTKVAPSGTRTRAQFVRDLLAEAKVKYTIPGLNIIQPIEEEVNEFGQSIAQTEIQKQKAHESKNKTAGVGSGDKILIKKQKPTEKQLANINIALKKAKELNAPPAAVEALIVAGITETEAGFDSEEHEDNNPNNPHSGIWQSDIIPGSEVAKQAEYFLKGGESFASGGAIQRAHEGKAPAQIAVEVEVGGSLSRNEEALQEAKDIIQAGGGVSSSSATPESDVSQLSRGTADNPDEDSFEAITRLAQQVDWFFFDDGHTAFYMDGPELAKQKIAAWIDIQENYCINAHTGKKEKGVVMQPATFTYDDTTLEYRKTHKVKGKVQKASKSAKPSTPSEVRLNLVCGITEYRAGQVFVIRGFGPANGRWIVSEATRQCLKDIYTEFTLEPPVEPLPEPLATTKGAELTGEGGSGEGALLEAEKALSEKSKYVYELGAGRQSGVKLFGPEPRKFDCSSFFILCYKEANLPDPDGSGYSSIGDTDTLIKGMKKISTPEPGCACFFGESEAATVHVQMYKGGGKAINMGGPGDPSEVTANQGSAKFLGYYTST